MATTIAIAGKGGTGKTTIAALLIKLLSRKGTVLAVDADPSTNLNQALGLPLENTVGRVREELTEAIKRGNLSPGVAKQDLLDYKIMTALVESKGLDLLAMGRPEGPGCYCAANEWLRHSLERLAQNYRYMVIDCEAGMEHISRQTTGDIDILLIISDLTQRGIMAAAKMKELIRDLRNRVGRICLIVNRGNGELPPQIRKAINDYDLELIATIPEDPGMPGLEVEGRPLVELPEDSPLQIGVREIASKVGL